MKTSLGAKPVVYPTPVWVVGTYDQQGKPNIMTAAWACICASEPPCLAVCLRKARHTYAGLKAHQAFTVSVPSRSQAKEADYAGMVSGKKRDKFADTGLTPARAEFVNAPYVQEFPMALECKLINSLEVGSHTIFVGEILDVKADSSVLGPDGLPDVAKVDPLTFAPLAQQYYALGDLVGNAYELGKVFMKK